MENPFESNKFELIFDEYHDGAELNRIFVNDKPKDLQNIDEDSDELNSSFGNDDETNVWIMCIWIHI